MLLLFILAACGYMSLYVFPQLILLRQRGKLLIKSNFGNPVEMSNLSKWRAEIIKTIKSL
ncbi:MAG: hypothetical protein IPL35_03045 [Sphingobacteriales bacterium]|nr:hypothetical protein [Sphingobacteriales bacterium]